MVTCDLNKNSQHQIANHTRSASHKRNKRLNIYTAHFTHHGIPTQWHFRRACIGLISNRKCKTPTASRWRWARSLHSCSSARSQFRTRIYHAAAQGHSAVLANSCRWALSHWISTKSRCQITLRLRKGELANAASPYNLQPFLIERAHSEVIKFSINKAFFGHRAILVFGGSRRG